MSQTQRTRHISFNYDGRRQKEDRRAGGEVPSSLKRFLTKTYARYVEIHKNAAAKIFISLKARPERTLAVIQVGITLVGILSAAVGGAEVEETILPFLQKYLNVSGTTAEIPGIALFVIPFTS